MFRTLWRFPLWGPSSTVTAAPSGPSESWAFPVWAYRVHSTHTVVRDPLDLVEQGHKEWRAD